MSSTIIYAAYGDNLDLARMAIRCPGAEIYGRAELQDHKMVFRGRTNHAVATVEPQTGSVVPVLLWRISQRNEKALDQYAGWPSFYEKKTMDFTTQNRTVPAMIYVMRPGHSPGYPSWLYFDTLIANYQECGFDPALLGKAMERSGELMQLEKVTGGDAQHGYN